MSDKSKDMTATLSLHELCGVIHGECLSANHVNALIEISRGFTTSPVMEKEILDFAGSIRSRRG